MQGLQVVTAVLAHVGNINVERALLGPLVVPVHPQGLL